LISFQAVLGRREIVPAIQRTVAQKLEQNAMNLVCASARYSVHHASAEDRKFCAESACVEAELLDCIGVWEAFCDLSEHTFIQGAVEIENSGIASSAAC
jgi:hypothetical protein